MAAAIRRPGHASRAPRSPTAATELTEPVEQDRPALDADDRERPVLVPRILCESLPDGVLAGRADDEQYLAITLQWAAEQDETCIDELVHEPGMIIEACLLPQAKRPVPRTAPPFPDRVQLHPPSLRRPHRCTPMNRRRVDIVSRDAVGHLAAGVVPARPRPTSMRLIVIDDVPSVMPCAPERR